MSTDFLTVVPPNIRWGLAAVGAVWLGSRFLNFVQFLVNAFILGGSNLRKYGKPGTWAVVTGASDGLGKEFAYQLASKGFNIVLVSRTQSKLEDLAKDIQAKFGAKGVQTKTLAMDYAQDNDADYQRLAQLVSGLDIGILINNVGQSHSIPVSFLQTSPQEMQNIITINCMGTLKTTKVVAPIMQRRKRGLIITMGSFGGWMPTPFLATYSGSKAFLQHWSAALASELQDDGIDVQFCLSYLVTTAMSKVRRTSLLIPNPRGFVRSALSKIGTGRWQNVAYTYTPWWSHALLQWVVENTVGASSAISIWYSHKMHVDIRNRALRKAAREAKKA